MKSYTIYATRNIAQNLVYLWLISTLITAENFAYNCCAVVNMLSFCCGVFLLSHAVCCSCIESFVFARWQHRFRCRFVLS